MYTEAAFKSARTAWDETINLIYAVAESRGWTLAERETALEDVNAALEDADQGFAIGDLWGEGEDVDAFFGALAARSESWGDLEGLDELQAAWGTAEVAAEDQEQEEDLGSVSGLAEGTVEGAAATITATAEEAVKPSTKILIGLAIAAAMLLIVKGIAK